MHQFVLSISSACDIPPDQIKAYEAFMFSTGFFGVSGEPSTADAYERAYKRIKVGKIRLSSASVKKIEDHFDFLLETKDKDIIYIAPASRADAHYSMAIRAAQNSLIKFPRRNIFVINANGVGSAMQPLFYLAYKMYCDGESAEDTVFAINELNQNLSCLIVTPDAHDTLRVNGVGERKLKLLYRVKSEAMIAKKVVEAFAYSGADTLYISHGNCPSLAIKIMQRLNEKLPSKQIQITKMSVIVALNLGVPALIVGF